MNPRIQAALKQARDIADAAAQDSRQLTDDEQAQIENYLIQARNIQKDDSLRAEILDLSSQFSTEPLVDPAGRPLNQAGHRGSPGQQFVAAIDDWRKNLITDSSVTKAPFGHSPRVVLNELIQLGGSTSAGEMTAPGQTGILVTAPRRPLRIQDVITVTDQINTDVVEYVRVTAETNNASVVAESSQIADDSPTDATTGYKPFSDATFDRMNAVVRTIAHLVAITRQALADPAQIRNYIDDFLRDGLNQALEDEIITGDGTGEHFDGIDHAAGLTQTFVTDPFITSRKARTKLMTQGRVTPNAWLINPLDAEVIDLLQDNEARYYGTGPLGEADQMRLWRVPVIEHEGVPEHTAYLGDFKRCILWPRSPAQVMMTDSHKDWFQRNMIALLGELRAAFAVVYPKAIVKVTLTQS